MTELHTSRLRDAADAAGDFQTAVIPADHLYRAADHIDDQADTISRLRWWVASVLFLLVVVLFIV